VARCIGSPLNVAPVPVPKMPRQLPADRAGVVVAPDAADSSALPNDVVILTELPSWWAGRSDRRRISRSERNGIAMNARKSGSTT
jgi:hypothetical protein